jgi:hypothetical protein
METVRDGLVSEISGCPENPLLPPENPSMDMTLPVSAALATGLPGFLWMCVSSSACRGDAACGGCSSLSVAWQSSCSRAWWRAEELDRGLGMLDLAHAQVRDPGLVHDGPIAGLGTRNGRRRPRGKFRCQHSLDPASRFPSSVYLFVRSSQSASSSCPFCSLSVRIWASWALALYVSD